MKILNKALSLLICAVMIFSSAVIPASAEAEEKNNDFSYSLKYYTTQSDSDNIGRVLDQIDMLLKEKNYSVSVSLLGLTSIKIDFSSINAICKTIDDFEYLIKTATTVLKPALGDLAQLKLSTWQKGLKRGSQDITIVKEAIELLFANKELIRKLCDGSLDAGVFNEVFNLDKLVGKDGIGGVLKKWIIGLIYEKDSADYNNTYDEYKDNFDAFIYGDFLNHFADLYLPGFVMDEKSTVEDLICVVFGLVVDRYIKPIIKEINIDTADSEYEALRALDGLINLQGSTYDFSGITFNPDVSFLSQVNNVVGKIFNQLIPGYRWQSGNYDKISENIEGAFKYLGKKSGLIEDADYLSFDEIVMQVIGILAKNVDLQGLDEGVTECETLEDMARVALINLTVKLGLGTTYKPQDTYLDILGDIAAHYLYNNFDVRDSDGEALMPGMGYDIFEVANFALNYLLFDKQLAGFLGMSTTKQETVFTKIDKLLDYFGETKSKGVRFNSEEFLFGDGKNKGLLEAVFSLDIEYILDITAVPALKNAGDVAAVKFIYNSLRNFINNWSGKNMIPEYTSGAFNNALKNDHVAVFVEYLIEILSSRKDSFIGAAALVGAVLFKGEDITLGEVAAQISDTVYSGGNLSPKATVTLSGKALSQYKDFVVVCTEARAGQSKAVIKGAGLYKGTSAEITFNTSPGKVKNLKAKVMGNKLTLSWQALNGAVGYTVEYSGMNRYVRDNFFELEIVPGMEYTFTVTAITSDGAKSPAATVSIRAESEKVKGLQVTKVTDKNISLSWKHLTGAKGYAVEIYDDTLKIWKAVGETVSPKAEITNLSGGVVYKFRVCAIFDTADGEIRSEYSDTVTASLKPSKVKNLDVDTVTSTTVKIIWDKVKGAKGYEIVMVDGYENISLGKVTATACNLTGLTPGSEYTFKVRAYVDGEVYGDFSSGIRTTTLLPKVKNLKTTKTASTSISLSWSKVKDADKYVVEIYKNKQWTKYGKTLTGTSVTVKNLSSATSYKFRVRAYSSENEVYSEYSDTHTAKTRVAGVKGLKTSSVKTSSLKLSWSKLKGAEGYVVYYSTDNKTWKKIDSTAKTAITVKNLKSKKTYYFKVRGYSRTNGKAIYGSYSSVLKTKTK